MILAKFHLLRYFLYVITSFRNLTWGRKITRAHHLYLDYRGRNTEDNLSRIMVGGVAKVWGMGKIGISMESDGVLQQVLFIWEAWEFW
jgi:hypothetical protein